MASASLPHLTGRNLNLELNNHRLLKSCLSVQCGLLCILSLFSKQEGLIIAKHSSDLGAREHYFYLADALPITLYFWLQF